MDTSAKSEKHENDDFLFFWKMNPKNYESQMKQNNSTELSSHSFPQIYNGTRPSQTPPRPQIRIFLEFPSLSIGSLLRYCFPISKLLLIRDKG